MIAAFFRALGQLGDPRVVRVLVTAVVLAVAVFAALWAGIAWTLTHTAISSWGWLETVLDVLGGLATFVLTLLLFPVVVSATICLFLERIALIVEARHYPDLPPPKGLSLLTGIAHSLRFLLVTLVLNLLLLPALLLGPVFPVLYLLVNGYLLGREYVDLVALRRHDVAAAQQLRKRHRWTALAAGIVTALLLTIPIVNLVAPVLATMATVHLTERWRRS